MPSNLAKLIEDFQQDEWRMDNGFSAEMEETQKVLFSEGVRTEEKAQAINSWIQKNQPCIFGRAAAAQHAIHYCLLDEADIRNGDDAVRRRIEASHLEWTRKCFNGRSSNFVLIVISERIATAVPNAQVMKFAKSLARLYLQEDSIEADRIYHDTAYLAIPDKRERALKWKAGVNYFAAHGDKRWWQDHRIPGGVGFSTNSVGHLVKSGKLSSALNKYLEEMGVFEDDRDGTKLDSLAKALTIAMQTIDNASNAVSGKATELLPLPKDPTDLPVMECPFKLPPKLGDKNFCAYRGFYHTDFTLPSEYFRSDVERPPEAKGFDDLDFTYLFHSSPDNPAHYTMGEGTPIRSVDFGKDDTKRQRVVPTETLVEDETGLVRALNVR